MDSGEDLTSRALCHGVEEARSDPTPSEDGGTQLHVVRSLRGSCHPPRVTFHARTEPAPAFSTLSKHQQVCSRDSQAMGHLACGSALWPCQWVTGSRAWGADKFAVRREAPWQLGAGGRTRQRTLQ